MSRAWCDPGTHAVCFHDDALSAARNIAEFLAADAHSLDPLVMVSRRETFDRVMALLASGAFGPRIGTESIRFIDAETAIERFVEDGAVDPVRGERLLLELLSEVRRANGDGTIRFYGEMVDILCERGNFTAARALESLFPGLFTHEPRLTVLCGYARARFQGEGAEYRHAICAEHTHAREEECEPDSLGQGEAPPSESDGAPHDDWVHVIDDDDSVRRSLGRVLKLSGFNVRTFDSGEAFLLELESLKPGCLVVDIQLMGMSGLDVLAHMKGARASWQALAMSGSDDENAQSEALRLGARAFLKKPLDSQVLLSAVAAALAG